MRRSRLFSAAAAETSSGKVAAFAMMQTVYGTWIYSDIAIIFDFSSEILRGEEGKRIGGAVDRRAEHRHRLVQVLVEVMGEQTIGTVTFNS